MTAPHRMSDIVERLRSYASYLRIEKPQTACVLDDGAAEIRRLRAERDALQQANAELNVEVSRLYACRNELQDVTQAMDDPSVNNARALEDAIHSMKARLAEKDASIARLKRAVDSDDGMDSFCDDLLEQFGPMQVQIDRQRARLAEAERDATRYRWLRGNASQGSERWMRWELRRWDGRSWHSLEFAALDAAIDAAMERAGAHE